MSASKKFRHTRELIKIALDDGMTQDEIGRLCRAVQSTVSKWKNGQSRATELQMEALVKRYGHRLQRATKRVYLLNRRGFSMTVVEGPIIFRLPLSDPGLRFRSLKDDVIFAGVAYETTRRWLVHQIEGPRFIVVRQARRRLDEAALSEQAETWGSDFVKTIRPFLTRWVQSSDDAAKWVSTVDEPRNLRELLDFVDTYEHFRNDEEKLTVRFLLRKALVEHGHPIPELEAPPAKA